MWGSDTVSGKEPSPRVVGGALEGLRVAEVACGKRHTAAVIAGRTQLFTWGQVGEANQAVSTIQPPPDALPTPSKPPPNPTNPTQTNQRRGGLRSVDGESRRH
eukprot:1187231-Prorocentrum_minimum.AAC.3